MFRIQNILIFKNLIIIILLKNIYKLRNNFTLYIDIFKIITIIKTLRYINKLDNLKTKKSLKKLLKELNINFLITKSMKLLIRNVNILIII